MPALALTDQDVDALLFACSGWKDCATDALDGTALLEEIADCVDEPNSRVPPNLVAKLRRLTPSELHAVARAARKALTAATPSATAFYVALVRDDTERAR